MAKKTHVNCKATYPGGPGVWIQRGEAYAPSPEELEADPRRWAPIGSRRAAVAAPDENPRVTATRKDPKGG